MGRAGQEINRGFCFSANNDGSLSDLGKSEIGCVKNSMLTGVAKVTKFFKEYLKSLTIVESFES